MPTALDAEIDGPEYSIVVPVYESDRSVIELVERLRPVFEVELQASYEIILVDDGSKSSTTWPTCERLAREGSHISAIRLMRNYGKPGAVLCGLEHVRGRFIVTIDDDLQQRPEDIPGLARFRDHDVVVASHEKRQHHRFLVLLSWIKSHFDRIILDLPCRMSPLKIFKAEVADGMLQIRTPRPFIPALLASTTKDFVSVAVQHDESRHGKSRYDMRRRLTQFSNLLINNSSLLLRWLGFFGVAVAAGGFTFALAATIRKIGGFSPPLPGWTSLVVINLVFGGLILIALAIIGEYLIRILEGISQRPPYLVRSRVGIGRRPVAHPNRD